MTTAVLYYTLSQTTRKAAEELARAKNADLFQIKPTKEYGLFSAIFRGVPKGRKLEAVPIEPIEGFAPEKYDSFVLACPIWGGYPAPPLFSALALLPDGAKVTLYLLSASGGHKGRPAVEAMLQQRQFQVEGYHDLYANQD